MAKNQDILSGKTSLEPSHQTKEKISDVSLKASATSRMKPYQFLRLISGKQAGSIGGRLFLLCLASV